MSNPPSGQEPPSRRHASLSRHLYAAAGLCFVALGIVGAFLPVLPTTPFMILAAACFARSSPRLESRLLNHPRFGPALRDWRERRAISPRAKRASLIGCAAGYGLFWYMRSPGALEASLVGLLMLTGIAYVYSRPSS